MPDMLGAVRDEVRAERLGEWMCGSRGGLRADVRLEASGGSKDLRVGFPSKRKSSNQSGTSILQCRMTASDRFVRGPRENGEENLVAGECSNIDDAGVKCRSIMTSDERLSRCSELAIDGTCSPLGSSIRNRMERPVLENLFRRSGSHVNRARFYRVAALCGLPACSGTILFDAVASLSSSRPSAKNELRSNLQTVESRQFMNFWESHLMNRSQDARLFFIMLHGTCANHGEPSLEASQDLASVKSTPAISTNSQKHSWSHSALERVTSDGFLVLAENFLKVAHAHLAQHLTGGARDLSRTSLAGIIAGCIAASLCGSARESAIRVKKSDFERISLCAALLAAENGRYHGPLQHVRPDRLNKIASKFCEARALSCDCTPRNQNDETLCESRLATFCGAHAMIAPKAVSFFCSLSSRSCSKRVGALGAGFDYCSSAVISSFAFTRLWLSCTSLFSDASVGLLFDLIDSDMDGIIGARDAFERYTEKNVMLERVAPVSKLETDHGRSSQVSVLPEFEPMWQLILDLVVPGSAHARGFSRLDLFRVSAATRGKVVQFLLLACDVDPTGAKMRKKFPSVCSNSTAFLGGA